MSFQFLNKGATVLALLMSVGGLSACGSGSKFTSSSLASVASASTSSTASTADSTAASTDATAGNFQILARVPQLPSEVTDVVATVNSITLLDDAGNSTSVPVDSLAVDYATLANATTSTTTSTTFGSSILQAAVTSGSYTRIKMIYSSIVVTYANGEVDRKDFTASDAVDPRSIKVVPIAPVVVVADDAVSHVILDFGKGPGGFDGFPSGGSEPRGAPRANPGGGPGGNHGGGPRDLSDFSVINMDATGSVAGAVSASVTDASGAVTTAAVANAHVVALKNGRPAGSAKTDSSGNYLMLGVLPGTYEVRVMARSYDDFKISDIAITAGTVLSQDATLAVDSASSN